MKKKLLITLGCSFTEGVGCYDPDTIPIDMVDRMKHEKIEEVYISNKSRFHNYSWPSQLQKKLKYDKLINLGLGGSSTSGNLKVWFEKYYDKNFSDDYDVLIIWMLPEPTRFSFYRERKIMNINPSMAKNVYNIYSYDLGIEYINFLENLDLDPILEQIFYLKIFEDHLKNQKYNFLYVPLNHTQNWYFDKLYKADSMINLKESVLPNFVINPDMKSLICNHPNEKGYEQVSEKIFEWIKKYKQNLISENNPTVYESVWDGYPILDHLEGYRTLI
jgi:hypothetical protein